MTDTNTANPGDAMIETLSRTDYLEILALMPTLTSIGRIPVDHPDWIMHRMRLIKSYDVYSICEQWLDKHGVPHWHENTLQLKHAIERDTGTYIPQGVAILALQFVFNFDVLNETKGITFRDHPELMAQIA